MKTIIKKAVQQINIFDKFFSSRLKHANGVGELSEGEPIVIFQMGKVGSAGVYHSLKNSGLDNKIYHVHILHGLEELREKAMVKYEDPTDVLKGFDQALTIKNEILGKSDSRIKLISLVRDPVRQALSAFFHGSLWHLPDIEERWNRKEISFDELTVHFLEKHNHNAADQWFDSQLKDLFGLDVFLKPFPHNKGYQIYRMDKVALLLFRLEDLDWTAPPALERFIGLKDFSIKKENTGSEKWYGELYRLFLKQARLPSNYVEEMYSSRFATHFYKEKELAGFRQQW